MGFNRQRGFQFTVAEHLHRAAVVGQAASVDVLKGDAALPFEMGDQIRQVNYGITVSERSVFKAALGQPALQGHLAAFKAGRHTAARTGVGTADQVKAFCREQLTGYKQPRFVEFRDELPKTNVGKILRKELRDPPKAA